MGHSQSSSSKATPITPPAPAQAEGTGVSAFTQPIVLNGLPGSGKSAVQRLLQVPEGRKLEVDGRFLTTPEIYGAEWGSNNRPTSRKALDLSVWSYGGRGSLRARWSTAAYATKVIVFTVDSTQRARLVEPEGFKPLPNEFVAAYAKRSAQEQEEIYATLRNQMHAKTVLRKLLSTYEMRGKPLLVLATKQDQPNAMSVQEIADALELSTLERRDWRIAGCNALTGEGVQESVEWMNYILAHPTDWSTKDAVNMKKQRQYQDEWAAAEIRRQAAEAKEQAREARLNAGHVLLAPPIFHTNGEPWRATEEQLKEFVVAPLTQDPAEQAEREEAAALANPLLNVQLAEQLLATIQVETNDAATPAETNHQLIETTEPTTPQMEGEGRKVAGEGDSPTLMREKESSVSEAQAGDTTDESVSHNASTVLEDDAAPADTLGSTHGAAALTAKRFPAFSNAAVVLPRDPACADQPVTMVKFKKHWYSRTKLVPAQPELVENIHRNVGGLGWGLY